MGSPPSNLRVIDCQLRTPEVVNAPNNCQYAALSYVWGSPQISATGGQSTEKFPRVVSDAILATTMLGMRYLWVDRHCINQDDESHKHQQIQQMGEIYSYAEVTLVAAGGSDASCGLPGIGSVGRLARARLETCGVLLQEGARHVGHFVKESVWVTRGWTLQESFLSRRRVIFTESEAAFLCNCSHAAESWRVPYTLPAANLLSIAPFEALTPKAFFSYDSTVRYKARAEMLKAMLEQYTARKLTYQSDALNACTGVFRLLETGEEKFICGLLTTIYSPRAATTNFTMWLAWYHKNPSRRRPGFPSWSFLGWDGPAMMGMAEMARPVFWNRTYEHSKGEGVHPNNRPPYLAIESLDTATGLSHRLRLQGRMFNINLRNLHVNEMQSLQELGQRQAPDDVDRACTKGVYAELEVAGTGTKELRLVCMDSANPRLGVYKGLFLWITNYSLIEPDDQWGPPILLFEKHQDVFERAGFIHHGSSASIWFDDRGTHMHPSPELRDKHRNLWIEQSSIETIVVV
ncbi:HET-domain-containing protein [Apiospora hydei]|uniref:HET-domain-containing protein n=1 Tax=Apiospora hydei TaxID=1337664 RepID=A0ABR1XA51_9PEZI